MFLRRRRRLRRLAVTGGLVGALIAYRQRRIARFERRWGYGPPRS